MPIYRRIRVNTTLPPLPPWNNFYTGPAGIADERRLFHLNDFLSLVNQLATPSPGPTIGPGFPVGPGPNNNTPRGQIVVSKAREVANSIAQCLTVIPVNPIENAVGSPNLMNMAPGTKNLTINGVPIQDPARPGFPMEANFDLRMHILHFCYLFSKFLFTSDLMRLNGIFWNRTNWLTYQGEYSFTIVQYSDSGFNNANLVTKAYLSSLPDPNRLAIPPFSNQPDILQSILSLYNQLNISVPAINPGRLGPLPIPPANLIVPPPAPLPGQGQRPWPYNQLLTDNKERTSFNDIFNPNLKPGRDFSDGNTTLERIRRNTRGNKIGRISAARVFTGFDQIKDNLASRETLNFANEIVNALNAGGVGWAFPGVQNFTNITRVTTLSVGKGYGSTSIFNLYTPIAALFHGYQLWAMGDSINYPLKRRGPRTYRLVANGRILTRARNLYFRSYGFDVINVPPAGNRNINFANVPPGISYIIVIINNYRFGFGTVAWDGLVNPAFPDNGAPQIAPNDLILRAFPIYRAIPRRNRLLTLPTNVIAAPGVPNLMNITIPVIGTVIATYDTRNGIVSIPANPNIMFQNNIQVYFGNNIRSLDNEDNEERHLMMGVYL